MLQALRSLQVLLLLGVLLLLLVMLVLLRILPPHALAQKTHQQVRLVLRQESRLLMGGLLVIAALHAPGKVLTASARSAQVLSQLRQLPRFFARPGPEVRLVFVSALAARERSPHFSLARC